MVELTPDQAVQRARVEEEQLQAMQERANQLVQVIAELKATARLLKEIPKEESNTLIPVGSGVFIEGKAAGTKTLMEIGAGNIMEKPIEDIIVKLEEREIELQATLKKIGVDAQALDQNLVLLRNKISDYVRRQQAEPDVPVIG